MELLTPELRQLLPPLYAQEKIQDPIVYIKFFTPDASWTWLATEGSQEEDDFIFFGYVIGHFPEWGYFALSELEEARGPRGLPIERDPIKLIRVGLVLLFFFIFDFHGENG